MTAIRIGNCLYISLRERIGSACPSACEEPKKKKKKEKERITLELDVLSPSVCNTIDKVSSKLSVDGQ